MGNFPSFSPRIGKIIKAMGRREELKKLVEEALFLCKECRGKAPNSLPDAFWDLEVCLHKLEDLVKEERKGKKPLRNIGMRRR